MNIRNVGAQSDKDEQNKKEREETIITNFYYS